jgi:tetratricopeptide (TPR) repeat protein
MRIKKYSILGLSLLLAACASSSPQLDENEKQSQAERKEKTKVYFSGMTAQKVEDISDSCYYVGLSSKKFSWTELIAQVNGCVRVGNWGAVEGWAFEISRNNIDSPWGLYYYSVAAEAKKDFPRALWMIEKAMKKSTTDVALFRYQRGRVLWEMSPSEAALSEVETALKFDPSLVAAHEFLGEARFRSADYKAAEKHFTAALTLDPKSRRAQKGLASLAMQTGSRTVASTAVVTSGTSSKEPQKEGAQK